MNNGSAANLEFGLGETSVSAGAATTLWADAYAQDDSGKTRAAKSQGVPRDLDDPEGDKSLNPKEGLFDLPKSALEFAMRGKEDWRPSELFFQIQALPDSDRKALEKLENLVFNGDVKGLADFLQNAHQKGNGDGREDESSFLEVLPLFQQELNLLGFVWNERDDGSIEIKGSPHGLSDENRDPRVKRRMEQLQFLSSLVIDPARKQIMATFYSRDQGFSHVVSCDLNTGSGVELIGSAQPVPASLSTVTKLLSEEFRLSQTEAVRKANRQAQMDKEQAMFEEAMRRREMEDEKLRMKLEQQQRDREKDAAQKKENQ